MKTTDKQNILKSVVSFADDSDELNYGKFAKIEQLFGDKSVTSYFTRVIGILLFFQVKSSKKG